MRVLRGLVLLAGSLASVAVALLVLGLVVPSLPGVGLVGSLLVDGQAARFLLVGVVVALACGLAWRCGARRTAWVTTVTAAVTVVGAAVALGAQLQVVHTAGVPLGWGDVLGATQPAPPADEVVTYATVEGRPLDAGLWLPAGPRSEPRPTVVWVHGGGFSGGDRDEQAGDYRYLAEHGYPVVSVDYRLAPPPRWQDATQDVVCALGWVTAHARQYGFDPARLVLSGGSAGGNLALNAAYGLAAGDVASSCGPVATAVPVAVAGTYPAADLVATWDDDGFGGYARTAAQDYLGGTPAEVPDRYAAASPSTRVRPGLMPTLLVTGANDHLVHVGQVRALASSLTAAGDDVELHVVPFSDHAFDQFFHSVGNAITRGLLLQFLRAHTG